MSGHWHKVVSGACKPKHAPPKAKYLEPLVGSTYNADGSFADVTRSLSLRLRDPSPSVMFKALLVIHTLVRQGNIDEVFPYWSGVDGRDGARSLGLLGWVNASASGGADVPRNFVRYGHYLGARLKCFAALKHDPVRTRAEAPASLRRSFGGEKGQFGPNRLRTLTVEKGLLREVTTLQKLLDSLVECKFAAEDTNDELVVMALRMLTKDLLVLFQAVNEGVINVLENYFEMSKVDATTSLKTYKIFCRQCEKVVAYLGVAKSLAAVLNVNVPNLRHAPVSLAGSLQEYLEDPNFERNREEYKENKRVADGKPAAPKEGPKISAPSASTSAAAPSTSTQPKAEAPKPSFQDFFASIESEQQSMFNPQTGSPSTDFFAQNQTYNPFTGQQVQPLPPSSSFPAFGDLPQQQPGGLFPQQTGMGGSSMGQSLFGGQAPQHLQAQPTGFAMGGQLPPSHNGFGGQPLAAQMTGANPFRQSTMFGASGPPMQPQPTGNPFSMQQQQQPGGLQPQATGYNPFLAQGRQSVVPPQQTGFPGAFGQPDRANGAMSAPPSSGLNGFSAFSNASSSAAPPSLAASTSALPAASSSFLGPPSASPAPIAVQPTGSRNPFAPPPGSLPPPKKEFAGQGGQSLNTLAMSAWERDAKERRVREEAARLQAEQAAAKQARAQEEESMETLANGIGGAQGKQNGTAAFADFFSSQIERLEGGGKNTLQAQKTGGGGLFSSIASEFATTRPKSAGENPFPSTSGAGVSSQATGAQSFLGSQPTGMPGFGTAASPAAPLAPQPTGFGGSLVKPFKPSSSFGASLASSLPPLQESANETPSPFPSSTANLARAASPGLGGGPGLSRQMTNPFRVLSVPPSLTGSGFSPTRSSTLPSGSLFSQPTGLPGMSSAASPAPLAPTPTGFAGVKPFQPTSSFGQSNFGGVGAGGMPNGSAAGFGGQTSAPTSSAPQISLI